MKTPNVQSTRPRPTYFAEARWSAEKEAHETFINHVMDTITCSRMAAERIFIYYHKHKLIIMDYVNRRYRVKHGALSERPAIQACLEYTSNGAAQVPIHTQTKKANPS